MEGKGERAPGGVILGWVLVLISWAFASMIGNGAELPRLALILPPLILGALFCVIVGRVFWRGWLLVVVASVAGYFFVRGTNSPVFDLGRRDLFLVASACLSVVSGGVALQYRSCRAIFLGFLVLVFLGHAWVSCIQALLEPQFAFFRLSRVDTAGVSGFYYHRNYLAGYLELIVPVFIAFAVAQCSLRGFWFWVSLSLLAIFLCFLTNSRGGFGVMLLGGAVSFYLQKRSCKRELSKRRPGWVLGVLAAGLLAVFVGGLLLWKEIFSNRGGISGGVEGRLGMAGIAIDCWFQSPLFGNGSHAYSYLFPKLYGGLGGWYGNAEMAHSDYLQTLCDYGFFGFIGVLLVLMSVAYVLFQQGETESADGWLPAAGVGVLVAEAVRATFDFNLHIAPNLMLFCFVISGTLVRVTKNKISQGDVANRVWLGFGIIFIVAVSVGSLVVGWREMSSVVKWWRMEQVKLQPSSEQERRGALREMCQAAPSFELLRDLGQMSLIHSLSTAEGLGQATSDWRKAVERHPFDGESLANYARCLDEGKGFGPAEALHARALDAVSRRENKYGVIFGVGWHLAKRGEDALKRRQPGEALFLYREAESAFTESSTRNFRRTTSNREAADWVRGRIEFLEGARIEPVAVPILDWRAHIE